MTTYKGIRGQTIRTIAGDASPLVTGDIWYNSTARKIRGAKIAAGSWSTGGNLNSGRFAAGQAGTQTACLLIAGQNPTVRAYVESYDGSSWTEIADVSTGRKGVGRAGTQTAALAIGGNPPSGITNVESWNGTSWTEIADITARGHAGGGGTSTAALAVGGLPGANSLALNEEWNGSSWTEVGDLNNGRDTMAAAGTANTAGIVFGGTYGTPPPANFYLKVTETWNGTAWTEVGDLNVGRQQIASAAQGSSTATLCIGGELDPSFSPRAADIVESWNGSSWSEVADLNATRQNMAGAGVSTDAMCFGGDTAPTNQLTESYNGTSWTEVADLATGIMANGGSGTSASAISMGGNTPPASVVTEVWNSPAGLETVTFTDS